MRQSFIRSFLLFALLVFADACVDRLFFDLDNQDESQLIVDGFISDEPGPYQIRLFKSSSINDNLQFGAPFRAKEVMITDDLGNKEILQETGPGIYETTAIGLRGKVGRSYVLQVLEVNGNIIESTAQMLTPVSEIDSLYHEFVSIVPPVSGPPEYGYKIFMDSKNDETNSKYLRWRFRGTYVSTSYPRLRWPPNCGTDKVQPPQPAPCSGFIWTGSFLRKVGECTCCDCFVTDHEDVPKLNDDQLSTGGFYPKVEVGFVPFNQWTFAYNKYMVVVEQMSLTKDVYNYWKTVRDQKEGATSLFQPAFGKIQTNMQSASSSRSVAGFFYATSIKKKTIFLTGADAPFARPEFAFNPPESNCTLWDACTIVFANASTTPPPEWE